MELVPSFEPLGKSERSEANVDAKRKQLGVEDGLKDIPDASGAVMNLVGWRR
jgi:hypothetical protein